MDVTTNMWKWLRMKFSAGCRTMATGSGVPRLRVLTPNTRCLKSESRAAGRALLRNEYSDEVQGSTPPGLAIRASRKQGQPLHDVARQGDTNEEAKRYVGGKNDETGAGVCRVRGYRLGRSEACAVRSSALFRRVQVPLVRSNE